MMAPDTPTLATTGDDFVGQFMALKQIRFSGQLEIEEEGGIRPPLTFYFYLGRLLYAAGGIHPVRRLYRSLVQNVPGFTPQQMPIEALRSIDLNSPTGWDYQLLCGLLKHSAIDRNQLAKIVQRTVAEVLFDVRQAQRIRCRTRPGEPLSPQMVLMDVEQAIEQLDSTWHAWQAAKIADRSPNRAPTIEQPEQLQQQTSPAVFQAMTTLLTGERTLRDLSVHTRRNVIEVTGSLLPFVQAGFVSLVEIADLPAPVTLNVGMGGRPGVTVAANGAGPVVACVDDSPLVCQTMEKILTSRGYQAITVTDSMRAIATLLTRKPNLIFLDLVMPNTNGYEICAQLRKVSAFQDTPVVILTGNDGIVDRLRAKLVGASDFLSKPVDAETVLTVVEKHLSGSGATVM
ncbi:MAG: response regulator [Cyanobacteria bacterium J06642_2]